jgi:uncharacterized membrane protein YhdT
MAMHSEPMGDPKIEQAEKGSAWVTVGGLLFIFDVIVFAFIPRSVRDGTDFMIIFFFVAGALALAMVIYGFLTRVRARNLPM